MKRVLWIFLASLLALTSGCNTQPPDERMQVVVSIQPLAWFAGRIAGSRAVVQVMVPPGGSPHTYEPLPRQMALLRHAALFLKAGSGVEFELDWMPRFLKLNPALMVCDASEGVQLLEMGGEGHDGSNDHTHNHRMDPHFWLDPSNGLMIADNVARCMAEADPEHAGEYLANAGVLKAELRELDASIRTILGPFQGCSFLVFHPAWGYYAHAYGLRQIAAESGGKELTPRQMQQVIDQARSEGIRVVFVSPEFSSSQASTIATGIGGLTRSVDPLALDYPGNLRLATESFREALR
ncbi:metal ABC transporter solute-binding protein, Zn/Mn family [Pelodictyon luteolum]|uniref:Adhesion protein, putative n=1 Tax=Chlorobium luteolum (strain DSM 273 / BCRC 81028 / 2530) TaxID=319225 RepID=Q3B6K2_CHLL3|nr:zinc ABC transporter substrate-binding protein [Pelodictyon luteolum]ABB23029.1 adhesion protein, putative [Pelodictyon luteolum DSM 273]